MYTDVINTMKKEMDKTASFYEESLKNVRAGRANPQLLDNITFQYYGTETLIKNAASISAQDARLLVIQPWDKTALKEIEKAILASNIGITPMNDGNVIRLPFPELTGERRVELTKDVNEKGEQTKITIRNHRRDAMEKVKKLEKDGEITEDELRKSEKEIQKETDKAIEKIDKISDNKNKELTEV